MNKEIITAVLLSVSAYQFTPAAAQEDLRTQAVSYRDLDLNSTIGQNTLDARVRRAARVVCGDDDRDLGVTMTNRKCRQAAMTRARPQMMLAMAKARIRSADAGSQTVVLNILR